MTSDPTGYGPIPVSEGVAPNRPRRLLDVSVSGLALMLLVIPLVLTCFLVRVTSPGPALFRQSRVGQGGRAFTILKFRTMTVGVQGAEVTAEADPRITAVGTFLRKTSLDELPQLWNVFKGDMTLVGIRPETYSLAELYPPEHRWAFAHRPGLTGPSQVRVRDYNILGEGESEVDLEVYINKLVPAWLAIDHEFFQRPTLRATLGVIGETARMVLGRDIPEAMSKS